MQEQTYETITPLDPVPTDRVIRACIDNQTTINPQDSDDLVICSDEEASDQATLFRENEPTSGVINLVELAVEVADEGLDPTKYTAVTFKEYQGLTVGDRMKATKGTISNQALPLLDGHLLAVRIKFGSKIKKPTIVFHARNSKNKGSKNSSLPLKKSMEVLAEMIGMQTIGSFDSKNSNHEAVL